MRSDGADKRLPDREQKVSHAIGEQLCDLTGTCQVTKAKPTSSFAQQA